MRLHNSNPKELESFVLHFLDGTLPDNEMPATSELLADATFCELLAEHAIGEALLREALEGTQVDVRRFEKEVPRRHPSGLLGSRHVGWLSLAATLLMAVTLGVYGLVRGSAAGSSAHCVVVRQVIGDVLVDGAPVAVGQEIPSGAQFRARGLGSLLRVCFADNTELRFSGDADVECREQHGQKHVRILQGQLSASVTPQPPRRPLIIQTNSARMEVLGTDLAVSAQDDGTQLNVATGSVSMRSQLDGKEVVVNRGNFAIAAENSTMTPAPYASAPSTWQPDLRERLPKDWRQGHYLPGAGSSGGGAIRAASTPNQGLWLICAPLDWSNGLFRVEEDTYLNYRIKMDHPYWYQVLIFARDDLFSPPNGHPCHEFQEGDDWEKIPAGQWRTISVPLSKFRLSMDEVPKDTDVRYPARPKIAPPVGATIYHLIIGSQDQDRALAIDKVWVTRGRPDDEDSSKTSSNTRIGKNNELVSALARRIPTTNLLSRSTL